MMTIAIDFNATSMKSEGAGWYKTDKFTNAHKVTGGKANPELGIEDIALRDPNSNSDKFLARVVIRLDNDLRLYGKLFAHDSGSLVFNTDQREYTENGQKKYADINATIPPAIQAQVLRYAEQFVVEKPVASAPATPAGEAVKQAPAGKSAPQENVDLNNLSTEQLQHMIQTGQLG